MIRAEIERRMKKLHCADFVDEMLEGPSGNDGFLSFLDTLKEQPVDYEEELNKCKANPLYFWDKYVKVNFKEQPVDLDKLIEDELDKYWLVERDEKGNVVNGVHDWKGSGNLMNFPAVFDLAKHFYELGRTISNPL